MRNMPSTTGSQHSFARAPTADIQRSKFQRDSGYKTTFDAGYLVPIFVDEALPGDTHILNPTLFARLATPLFPFMDNLYMDTFYFAVPLRLVWDNFERFMGAQDNPDDPIDYLVPTVTSPAVTGWTTGSVADYFGLPIGIAGLEVDSLAFRAYNLIYNQWFRDENLQDSVVVDKGDGPDDPADYVLLRRGKRYDYFTSALPFPQKGDAVSLPLGTSAPVERVPNAIAWSIYNNAANTQPNAVFNITASAGNLLTQTGVNTLSLDPRGGLVADLSDATAATINDLREAFQIQRMLERDARGGTRYIEIIESHFKVKSPDARLQRAEYLGGGSTPIVINPIAQTSSTSGQPTPQANLAAVATAVSQGKGFTKSFVEHSLIIGLVSVRADLNYQQGINRMWSRQTRYDFYWPTLAHLGEQAILNKEIYADGSANDEEVFGYQERYAEMRYKPSLITGLFRSNASGTLDVWHLAQDFATLPVLNDEFIQENPPVDRVKALDDAYPDFLLDCFFKLTSVRPMPMFGTPGLIDHF